MAGLRHAHRRLQKSGFFGRAAPTCIMRHHPMNPILRAKIIQVCDSRISAKGLHIGLSFYAFFSHKNDDPTALMDAAQWWILENKLDHFEKAVKIRSLALATQPSRTAA